MADITYSNDTNVEYRHRGLNQQQEVLFQKYQNRVSIQENTDQIVIKADNVPLGVLLRHIEFKTGIHFIIPQSVWDNNIKTRFTVSNWKEAVNIILQAYNRAGHWDSRLNFSTVHILSKESKVVIDDMDSHSFNSYNNPDPGLESVLDTSQEEPIQQKLTFDQLNIISSGKLRSPLPPSLFDDAEILMFLQQSGVKTMEDAEDIKKAMRVRVKARKQLREME